MASRARGNTAHRRTPDPLAAEVGARIRSLRLAAGFTFDAFVEETGLGRGYISELERGLVVPSLTALARIAGALEVTLADLVAGESPRELLFIATRSLFLTEVLRLRRSAEATAKRLAAKNPDGEPARQARRGASEAAPDVLRAAEIGTDRSRRG